MDFFTQQDRARLKTSLLILFFLLGLVSTVVCVLVFTVPVSVLFTDGREEDMEAVLHVVGVLTTAIILLASLFKLIQLRSGGAVVAQQLDGRLIQQGTTEFHEKRLLNIVEEMAIAAGIPVPPVYVLDNEMGINAFAAGYRPTDAVIGVTQGMLANLTREEQQGVIAHEFSHILNGDMRMSLRLLAMIHGLFFLATLGHILMRLSVESSRPRSREDKDGAARLLFIFVGLGLFVIGQASAFFGRLMQSAVSRQREYLADASAVQFTRNPEGLANALKKIANEEASGRIAHSAAAELRHLFFAGRRFRFWMLMATHPPLQKRIQRLLSSPGLGSTDPSPPAKEIGYSPVSSAPRAPSAPSVAPAISGESPSVARLAPVQIDDLETQPQKVSEAVGDPMEQHLNRVREILASQPAELLAALRDPLGASAVVLGLLLANDPEIRRKQKMYLRDHAPEGVPDVISSLEFELLAIPPSARLPMVDLALPALRQMSDVQMNEFYDLFDKLADADQHVSLFEYVLQYVLCRHLLGREGRPSQSRIVIYGIRPVEEEFSIVLSTLARQGGPSEEAARAAFQTVAETLQNHSARLRFLLPMEATLDRLHDAIGRLALTTFRTRKILLEACTQVVAHDHHIQVEEAELLRALADALDCPVPVWIRGAQN